jgi:hypothetical protein
MKVETIVTDAAINFADCVPDIGDRLENAFEKIYLHENVTGDIDPDDFEVYYSSDEPTNNFGGAFITSIFGSYLLHDMREEQIAWYENDPTLCTVLFYSLSKISD